MMRRIILIDGCSANIVFPAGDGSLPMPTMAVEGGRLIKSAVLLGEAGNEVIMMGEAGRDRLGDLLVGRLDAAGVDTSCIDRYSDGAATPSILVFPAENAEKPASSIVYRSEMAEHWDCKWPRIDAGDIVLFGGYFALCGRVRDRLTDFIKYARQRGVLTVNLPGYNPALAPAVTRIMPALLEDFELADAVVTSTVDIDHLFPGMTPEECYREKISFYAPLMLNVDAEERQITLMYRDQKIVRQLPDEVYAEPQMLPALPVAMFADALSRNDIRPQAMESLSVAVLNTIADACSAQSLASNIEL